MVATRYADYRQTAQAGLAAYRRRHFAGRDALFEPGPHGEILFRPEAAHLNFFDPALYHAVTRRPRAFRRLGDPQVLAISVFGTLARREDLALLAEVACDDGAPVVAAPEAGSLALELQHRVSSPRPGRPMIVDVWLHRAQQEVIPSSPRSPPSHREGGFSHLSPYGEGPPQGAAIAVLGRLLERGAGPLARTIRAVAADAGAGHGARQGVLLVYDARNPAFARGRQAYRQIAALQGSLLPPLALRRTTWQALAAAMARSAWYSDLLAYLQVKYGIEAITREA